MGLNALPIQPDAVLGVDRNSVSPSGAGVFGECFIDPTNNHELRFVLASDETIAKGLACEFKASEVDLETVIISNAASGSSFAGVANASPTAGQGFFVVTKGLVESYVDAGASAGDGLVPSASGSFTAISTLSAQGMAPVAIAVDAAVAGGKVTVRIL